MSIASFLFPLVYSALFGFAIVFLLTTPNKKFYPKILFTVFVSSLAIWGWSELLSNDLALRQYVLIINQIGFFSALIAVQSLMLIGAELVGLPFQRHWFFYALLFLSSLFVFIPNFMIVGYHAMKTYVDLTPGFGNLLYNTEIILFAVTALLLFILPYKKDDTLTRKRIEPIIAASIFCLFVGVFFNILLPEVFNIEQFTSVAPLSVTSLVVALAYSIYKWNLLGLALNETVSYGRIAEMWKTKSPDLYRAIRDTFFSSLKYFPNGVSAQKMFFPSGKVNKKGNVYLFNSFIYKLIYVYYSFYKKVKNGRIFILGNKETFFILVTDKNIEILPPELSIFVIQKFSELSLYQKSVENIFEGHLINSETDRPI